MILKDWFLFMSKAIWSCSVWCSVPRCVEAKEFQRGLGLSGLEVDSVWGWEMVMVVAVTC